MSRVAELQARIKEAQAELKNLLEVVKETNQKYKSKENQW